MIIMWTATCRVSRSSCWWRPADDTVCSNGARGTIWDIWKIFYHEIQYRIRENTEIQILYKYTNHTVCSNGAQGTIWEICKIWYYEIQYIYIELGKIQRYRCYTNIQIILFAPMGHKEPYMWYFESKYRNREKYTLCGRPRCEWVWQIRGGHLE